MTDSIPCLWMRGGTSKGAVFLASDLPSDPKERDSLLLSLFGSPDPRQIDGIGGGDPLTSKVAVLSKSDHPDADIDYYFLQVFVDQPQVSDAQGCGNILAAVGPAALELGLAEAQPDQTSLNIRMVNTGEIARAVVQTPGGKVSYTGTASIDGVPGTHAPVELWFGSLAGSMANGLLPTSNEVDIINDVPCTLIDNGMPCVIMPASVFGIEGTEDPEELDASEALKARIEAIRLQAGPLMGLGDVTEKSVPKMTLVSPPLKGGVINTRSFIPHRAHKSIGVFASVTVATAALLKNSPAHRLAQLPKDNCYAIEHPTGAAEVLLLADNNQITGCGTIRTTRKIMQGRVFPST